MRTNLFNDKRSKKLVLIAHCILNQNAISDETATHAGSMNEIIDLLQLQNIGIFQMPCPELQCLGLDRNDVLGGSREVVQENSRIRMAMDQEKAIETLNMLVKQLIHQISEYLKYGFDIIGIIGINRSPSCGVETTSKEGAEIAGQGVFIEALQQEFSKRKLHLKFIGIKASEPEEATERVKKLIGL